MSTLLSFEELEAYKLARDFRKEVATLCQSLPKSETHRLIDQLVRASRSVPANIAEGFGRHHHRENLQFCRQARGSLVETLEHLNCALDEGYITQARYEEMRELNRRTWKVLNGYITYLQKCAKDGVLRSEEADHC